MSLDDWNGLGTATVSDALDRLGIGGQVAGIRPIGSATRMIGRAFTVRFQEKSSEDGTVGDFLEMVLPGQVVVLDNGGRLDATVWGDLMTTFATQNGIAGTVIDGVCRDSDRIRELDYPLFSRGSWMRTGKDRVELVALNETVSVGGIEVKPNDLILGDLDGVVVVPKSREKEILQLAIEVETAEAEIRRLIEEGVSLRDARAKLSYHMLQRRE